MDISDKRLFLKIDFGERLAQARTRLKLSQEALAEAVGTTARSISRWEHDQAIPQHYYRQRLCEVLQCTPEELFADDEEKTTTVSQPTTIWYVPYTRNPYFIGREDLLMHIHEMLHTQSQIALTQPQILSGLGGIGKTQTALEYAYRFRDNYQTVLWIRAETTETLQTDYITLAHLFQLPEKDSSNYSLIETAVKHWFQSHSHWLLIFDNVEDLDMLHRISPDSSQGHILITTRTQITGTLGSHLNVQKMTPVEGKLFLLRRAKLIQADAPLENVSASLQTQADKLVELLDGLPLALDQAAAYIEETACSLSEYLERYTLRRKDLLNIRGTFNNHHPASVATTLSLTVQQVEQASPIAVDLLRLCAFLHAEAIPEELFSQAEEILDPHLQFLSTDPLVFDTTIKELRRFSLIHREQETKTLSIHRLLQAIIKDDMNGNEHKRWIELTLRILLQVTPDYKDVKNFDVRSQSHLQRYLSHMLMCATHIKEGNIISDAAEEFLHRLIIRLQLWGDSIQAQSLTLQALELTKKAFGENNVKSAPYYNLLALYYSSIGQHSEAEDYFNWALELCEQKRGPNHPEVAENLWGLANLFIRQGKYRQAESYAQRALTIQEHNFGPYHHEVAQSLNVLAMSLTFQHKYTRAEELLLLAINIYEKTFGKDLFFVGNYSTNLGNIYAFQGEHSKAIEIYKKALHIYEKRTGTHHLNIATVAQKLGHIYFDQKDYFQAKTFYQKSLNIYQQFPKQHVNQAYILINLGTIYMIQRNEHLAQDSLQHACIKLGEVTQLDHVDYQEIIRCQLLVGDHLNTQGQWTQAQMCYQRAFTLGKQMLRDDHPLIEQCQNNLEKAFISLE